MTVFANFTPVVVFEIMVLFFNLFYAFVITCFARFKISFEKKYVNLFFFNGSEFFRGFICKT